MELRKYQIDIAAKATGIIKQYRMVYLAMQVRTGKTLTALSVADNLNIHNCLFLTKKKAIASIEHDYRLADRKYAIHVTNYEQLGKFPADRFDLIVCDESHCFTGETLIGSIRIDEIKKGDMIDSYNHKTFKIEPKKVLRVFENKSNKLLRISLGNSILVCTETHPFWIEGKGYVQAKKLEKGDICYELQVQNVREFNISKQFDISNKYESNKKGCSLLFGKMFKGLATFSIFYKKTSSPQAELCNMSSASFFGRVKAKQKKNNNEHTDLLFGVSVKNDEFENKTIYNSRNKSKVIFKNETKQPNEKYKNQECGFVDFKKTEMETSNTRRKRETFADTANRSCTDIWKFFFDRISNKNTKTNNDRVQYPNLLQSRFGKSCFKNSNRDRWIFSFGFIKENIGYKKNKSIKTVRVESIEVYKQGNSEQRVYNLEVEGNNNYFANGILVHNCLGAYPKPSLRAKTLKAIVKNTPVIYLSGTPTPEGYSQIFHQFYISNNSPYSRYYNFYTWARDYVKVFEEKRGPYMVKNYSDADVERIKEDIEPIIITYSQEEAGFKCEVVEHINEIDDPIVQQYSRQLFKQRIIETENKKIVADSPATLMSKLHQIGSGTCITDNGTLLLSDKKAVYIKEVFRDMRIAIYYKFVAELDIIKKHFSDITTSPEDFQKGLSNVFVSQIQSGREGIALSTADCIVFYNIDFSAVSYWQARARLQSLERSKPAEIHWLFTNGSIDKKVYAAVTAKKDFTASYFFRHGGL
jgi:intein/homing endonuclease